LETKRTSYKEHVVKSRYLFLLLACAASLWASFAPRAVQAAGVVGNGTPGSCTEAAFRAALAGGGNVTFNCGGAPHTIALTQTNNIAATTSIDGGGLISLIGGDTPRVFSIASATLNLANITIRDTGSAEFSVGITVENRGTLNLSGVTFINNNKRAILNAGTLNVARSRFEDNTSSAGGSAISNESGGTLTIADSVFVNNRSRDGFSGGAIYNSNTTGAVAISRSVFSGNSAGGGGALVNFGTMTISDSTFSGNTALNGGGAIEARSGATLNIVNTTISGNSAPRGGGIYALGPTPSNAATLTNVTLAANTAPADAANQGGGNITVGGEVTVTLRNTIVANPGGSSSNCKKDSTGAAAIVDGGGNLQFPGTSCGASIASANPGLSALDDNGGPTPTHAFAANSPARNAANSATCPAFDQRGVLRTQAGACDIGAWEYGAVPVATQINNACAPRGSAFAIIVSGSNFITGAKGSRILVNGTALATTLVNPTQLRAIVPAGLLTGASGTPVPVTVQTPVVDGGTSGTLLLRLCYTVQLPLVIR
jgi:predicted outer membrane repeat protein